MSASNQDIELIADHTPVVTSTSTAINVGRWDHLFLYIDFTLGSLTNVIIKLQLGISKAGSATMTYHDAYDGNQTLCSQTFTASAADYAIPMTSETSTTRLVPYPLVGAHWRIVATPTGSTTSSSLAVYGREWIYGRSRD